MADLPISGLPAITVVSSSYLLAAVSESVTAQMTVKQVGDAYSSSLSGSFVPYTGATANVNLGAFDITSGDVFTSTITTTGTQPVLINGSGTENGGIAFKHATTQNIKGLNYTNINASGTTALLVNHGTGTFTNKSYLIQASGLTDDVARTYTLPDASGTIALLSDITSSGTTFPYTGSAIISGSLGVTGSVGLSYLTEGAAVWSAGGAMITARAFLAGAGTNTAALAFGGSLGCTEAYNGTSWSADGAMITGRALLAGAGTNTAALAFGGGITPTVLACTETYNGSTWSAGSALITARRALAGAGTNTAALAFGGDTSVTFTPANSTATEAFNGTSWSVGGAMITGRGSLAGAGTNTAALAFGGGTNPGILACTEAYNGTSWTAGGALITARTNLAGAGTYTAALAFGGNTPTVLACAEAYNGSTWSEGGAMITGRRSLGGAGASNTAALAFGGYAPPTVLACTETFSPLIVNCTSFNYSNTTGQISATGSLFGSASYAVSASYAPTVATFPYTGSAQITGSLGVTGSLNVSGSVSSSQDINVNGITIGKGAGAIASNTAIGNLALNSNTTGTGNIAIGSSALELNATGFANTAAGLYSLQNNTSGSFNTAYGGNSLQSNTTGSNNTAVGYGSLIGNTTGVYNTVIGRSSGAAITTGNYNTIIGKYAGTATMDNNIILADGQGNIGYKYSGSRAEITGSISQTSVTSSLIKADANGTLVAAVGGIDYTPTAYLSAYHTASLTVPVANTECTTSFSTTDFSGGGITISGSYNDKIKVTNAGVYNIQFSAQIDKTNSSNANAYFWLNQNGTSIPWTNTSVAVFGGSNEALVAAWNFYVSASANDYFQLMFGASETNVIIEANTPTVGPQIPSLILTVNRIA
jgi:hypothetical protein